MKSGKAMKAIDTFRFTSSDQSALEQIAGMYGGTVEPWSDPKAAAGQFEVITTANEIAIVLTAEPPSQHYELWTGGGCERRCDGETCTTTQQGPDGPEPVEVPCICSAKGALACKLKTRLSVILPGVQMSRGVTWRLDTGSMVAASALPEMVEIVQQLQGSGLTHATLSLRHVKSGNKRYIVPQIGVPHTIEQLASGGSRLQSLDAGGSAVSSAPALTAGSSGEEVGGLEGSPSSAGERTGSNPAPDADPSPDPDDEIADAEIVEDDEPVTEAPKATTADGHATGSDCSICGQPYGTDKPLVKGHQGESRYVHRDCRTVDEPITDATQRRVFAELRKRHIGSPERHAWATTVLGREVTSFKEVTEADAVRLMEWFEANPAEVVSS